MNKKKLVVIINGKGGVGKDSCILSLAKNTNLNIVNVSSIEPVKKLAIELGWWDGKNKDDRSRAMLSYLKQAMIYGDNSIDKYIFKEVSQFLISSNDILFIHIRESEEIKKIIDKLQNVKDVLNVSTLLITREDIENKSYGNTSDDNVECGFVYDHIFENKLNTGLEEFPNWFKNVVLNCESEVNLHAE